MQTDGVCPKHDVDVFRYGYSIDEGWMRCPGVSEALVKRGEPKPGHCLFTRAR